MLNANQLYETFILKINNNAITSKVSCDKSRFAVLFNLSHNKLIEFFLDKKFEDDIRYIQHLLTTDVELSLTQQKANFSFFKLPKDYFDFSSLYAEASSGKCKKQRLDLFEVKDDNVTELLQDSNNNPSFKYRESLFSITSDKLKIYKDETFTVDKAFISYYKYPKQIKLVDEDNPESPFVEDIMDGDSKFLNRVIDLAVSEFLFNNDDPKYNNAKANAAQKI